MRYSLRDMKARESILYFGLLLLLGFSSQAQSKDGLQLLFEGKPTRLGPSSYVEVRAKKLSRPKLVYLNIRYLKEMGIAVPETGVNESFLQQLYEEIAYVVPGPKDDPSLFTSEEKIFYADRYGGMGLNSNLGSGRAASIGQVQIKGIGRTPLVNPIASFDHAHGRANDEVINEAIWGELGQELPYGANRVIAIIDTGTFTHWPDGGKEKNFIVVREDPIRPAHFLSNPSQVKIEANVDQKRVSENLGRLQQLLPHSKKIEENSSIDQGMKEFVKRIASQYAWNYVNRIFHGATSQSNIEIDGKMIDYGTMTSQPGYAPIMILDDNDAFGDTTEFKRELISNFTQGLPMNVSNEAFLQEFDSIYEFEVKRDFVLLSGIPVEIMQQLLKSNQPLVLQLGQALHELVRSEKLEIMNVDRVMPDKTSQIDLQTLFQKLIDAAMITDSVEIENSFLENEKPVARAFVTLIKAALQISKNNGISEKNFLSLMKVQSKLRTEPMNEVYRPRLKADNLATVFEYSRRSDPKIIWNHIESKIEKSQRWLKSSDPFVAVLNEHWDPFHHTRIRVQFNARTGSKEMIVSPELSPTKDSFYFFQHKISLSDFKEGHVRITFDQWRSFQDTQMKWVKGEPQFQISIPDGNQISLAEFVLSAQDGKQWWKAKANTANYKLNCSALLGGNISMIE